uniref:Protein of unassigned function n=2 Tax=Methylobacterium oryzae TaxID=334852 RepID=A0A088B373_9HYPH|nr:protein of unassigned function [Methylobacterium oryzae CBMB20]
MTRPDWMNDPEAVRQYLEIEAEFGSWHARGHQLTPQESAELAALLQVAEPPWFRITAYVHIGFFIEGILKPGSNSTTMREVLEAVARSPAEAVAALRSEDDLEAPALKRQAAYVVRVILASTHELTADTPAAVFELAAQMQKSATRMIEDLGLQPRRGAPARNDHLYSFFAGITDLTEELGADPRIPGNAWVDIEDTPFSSFAKRALHVGVDRARRVLSCRPDVIPTDRLSIAEELDRLDGLSNLAIIKAIRAARKPRARKSADTPE